MSDYSSFWPDDYRPGGFSEDMEQVHGAGCFYVFSRRGFSKRIQRGFIREIDPPYRRGRGLQVRVFGRVLGFGVCRKQAFEDPYEATKNALEAKDLDADPETIGDWGR